MNSSLSRHRARLQEIDARLEQLRINEEVVRGQMAGANAILAAALSSRLQEIDGERTVLTEERQRIQRHMAVSHHVPAPASTTGIRHTARTRRRGLLVVVRQRYRSVALALVLAASLFILFVVQWL